MSLLTLAGVAGARGGRRLFAGVALTLAAGGAAVVTGPNGVGKTTLLRIAAGLLPPAAGRIARGGASAWLGEAAALDGERPLGAALAFWARLDGGAARGGATRVGEARVGAAMAAFALDALADVPVRYLSTGQRRRAALARVVAAGAPLWLLDEPASGLDAASVARLEAALAAHRAGGGAVLLATHQPLALPGAAAVALA